MFSHCSTPRKTSKTRFQHLLSSCWRMTCSRLCGHCLLGNSCLGNHCHCVFLSSGHLFRRHLFRGEVDPWTVEAERARDVKFPSYRSPALGLGRALWCDLKKTYESRTARAEKKKVTVWFSITKKRYKGLISITVLQNDTQTFPLPTFWLIF